MPRLCPKSFVPLSMATFGVHDSPWSKEVTAYMCCCELSPTEKVSINVCEASGETAIHGLSSSSAPLLLSVVVVALMPADQVAPPLSEYDDSMNMSVGTNDVPCWTMVYPTQT